MKNIKKILKNKEIKKIRRKKRKNKVKLKQQEKVKMNELKNGIISAPKIFSISKNIDEMNIFFEKIKSHCQSSRKKLVVDMRKIGEVDVDALMYLKYIVFEIKELIRKDIKMTFTAPENVALKKFIYTSGFVTDSSDKRISSYMKNRKRKTQFLTMSKSHKPEDTFTIKKGNKINLDVIRDLVNFTQKYTLKKNKDLYSITLELMENTVKHAYEDDEKIEHKDWFLFAKRIESRIYYVFLDTGLGIPKTVYKNNFEKLREKILEMNESSLLASALNGEFRSKTEETHRGKGLPFIYECNKNLKIENLKILSNKACYNINKNQDLDKVFKGTLWYWEISF